MSNILFCMAPLVSETYGSFRLAKQLRQQGHRVVYMGVSDGQELVEKEGFTYVSVFERYFPKGYTRSAFSTSGLARGFAALVAALLSGADRSIHGVVESLRPDLLIVGTQEFPTALFALIAHRYGARHICLNQTFHRMPILEEPRLRSGPPDPRWLNDFDKLSKFYEFPAKYLGLNATHTFPLAAPLLFVCPAELELPESIVAGCCYAEASIDFDRREPAFDWSVLDASKPLIYCTLGSLMPLGADSNQRFYQDVITALRSMPSMQAVISTGPALHAADFNSVPPNVHLVNWAPQLSLLNRACLVITSGGMSTIKEAILMGVPIAVVPQWNDQWDNARRVGFHGIGTTANFHDINPETILALIDSVKNSASIRKRIDAMSKVFKEKESSNVALEFVNDVIAAPAGNPRVDAASET